MLMFQDNEVEIMCYTGEDINGNLVNEAEVVKVTFEGETVWEKGQ